MGVEANIESLEMPVNWRETPRKGVRGAVEFERRH